MKYIFYTLVLFLFMSLLFIVNGNVKTPNEQTIIDTLDSELLDTSKTLDKANEVLMRSENLEEDFEKTYIDNSSLWKMNKELKKENCILKDSVRIVSNELKIIQIHLKQPKKRNLIQKVFNITPDTIETLVLDTIQ